MFEYFLCGQIYQIIFIFLNFILFYLFFDIFMYLFLNFNWRLITFQYCIGFAIHQHESATSIPELLICV